MGIMTKMKPYVLQNKTKIRSGSGASKKTWTDGATVDVAVYEKNEYLNTQSARYNESSHTGLTYAKNIKAFKNQLKDPVTSEIYEIKSAVSGGRMTNLLLKKVDTDV